MSMPNRSNSTELTTQRTRPADPVTCAGRGGTLTPIFQELMTYNNQKADPLTVVLELPDREALIELLSALETRELSVVTRDIRRQGESIEQSVQIDLGTLTTKQRRALELALRNGYYERPREIDLATLAERLGISKSAVSQRLRSAERKLIEDALQSLL